MYILARISRAIFIGPILPRSRIITRHLLRHNTYFNWGLRAAAHTMHQSRRFIRNSCPRDIPWVFLHVLLAFSLPLFPSLSRRTCLWSRKYRNIYNTTILGSLTRILETKRKVRALISRLRFARRESSRTPRIMDSLIAECLSKQFFASDRRTSLAFITMGLYRHMTKIAFFLN